MSKVIVDGVEWQEFLVEFQTQEGTFDFKLFAVDWSHAIDRLEELKATAKVIGDNCSDVSATSVQEHQINQLEKFKNHVLANANALGVVLDAPAAPVQEPVAYRSRMRNRDGQIITGWVVHTDTSENPDPRIEIEPLYTTPPSAKRPFVGLTNEEIQTAWDSAMDGAVFTRREVYKAIEAKLKEKNT